MISFASLFVGLVFGLVNVELVAAQGVARVDLLLDGRAVAVLHEPWRATLDLGCTPAPHELVAVAYDGKGMEVDRARQWVNRPRSTADASLVVEPRVPGAPRVAHLSWRSLTGEVPKSVVVTLDDRWVPVMDPSRFELPPHDPYGLHAVRATLTFPGNLVATAEALFGGTRRTDTFREMTGFVVELPNPGRLPPPEALVGWFEKDGVPLEVAAVEKGPYDVVFVLEGSARAEFLDIVESVRRRRSTVRWSTLPADLRYRFFWPVGAMATQRRMVANTYPITSRMTAADGDFLRQVTASTSWPGYTADGQRLADAVAVAALAAAEEGRRRAVVLVLGPEAKDASLLSRSEVVSFLADLNVPLVVWSVGVSSPEAARWTGVASITVAYHIDSALRALFARLERQRVVWVEGAHLPQSVALCSRAGVVWPAGSAPLP
jgi:hypothetical protein